MNNSRNNEFSFQQKTEIYFNQYIKNYTNLHKLSSPHLDSHLVSVKSFPNYNNLIPCPYCVNCYIYPGENVANELVKRYNIQINLTNNMFSKDYIRPGQCDHIIPYCKGGSNNIDNGIFICAQCNKLKFSNNLFDFFNMNFTFYNNRFWRKPEIPVDKVEIMDIDFFENKCFSCNQPSKIKICPKCAGRKNEIVYLAQ